MHFHLLTLGNFGVYIRNQKMGGQLTKAMSLSNSEYM